MKYALADLVGERSWAGLSRPSQIRIPCRPWPKHADLIRTEVGRVYVVSAQAAFISIYYSLHYLPVCKPCDKSLEHASLGYPGYISTLIIYTYAATALENMPTIDAKVVLPLITN
jgi:hypothetical protein